MLARLRKLDVAVQEAGVALDGLEPVLAVIGHLHLPGGGHVAEADVHARDGLALGGGHRNEGVLDRFALPVGGVLLVGHLGVLAAGVGDLERTLVRDINGLRRQREGRGAQQQQGHKQNQPFHGFGW